MSKKYRAHGGIRGQLIHDPHGQYTAEYDTAREAVNVFADNVGFPPHGVEEREVTPWKPVNVKVNDLLDWGWGR